MQKYLFSFSSLDFPGRGLFWSCHFLAVILAPLCIRGPVVRESGFSFVLLVRFCSGFLEDFRERFLFLTAGKIW